MLEKYFEGYYCKDDYGVECISTKPSRKVLQAITNSYPLEITQQRISELTGISYNTITGVLETLVNSGFITKEKIEKRSRGRPAASSEEIQRRGYEYYIENRNFALNRNEAYQLAPGYTKYKPDFLYAWDTLVEKDQQNEIFPLLVNLLRQVVSKIKASNDPSQQKLTPVSRVSTDGFDMIIISV